MAIANTKDTATANQVAEYFIWLCNQSGSFISNLKLQKILYYAQGWHLGLCEKKLFNDTFQAWVHGPAIPHIYGKYKKFGYQPIPGAEKPKLNEGVEAFLKEIADVILPIDAYELELATHREPPWIIARKGLPPDAPCKNEISENDMRDYFSAQAKEHGENKLEKA